MHTLLLLLALSLQAPTGRRAEQALKEETTAKSTTRPAVTARSQGDTLVVHRNAPEGDGPKSTDWIVATFTIVLAYLAYRQWVTSDKQRAIMDNQMKLMRDQFAATNRPRLTLRRIIQRPRNRDVTIEIANAGGIGVANAELRVWFGVFPTTHPVPADAMEGLASAEALRTSIPHGGSTVIVVPTPDHGPFERDDVRNGTQTVYCFGYVSYQGEGATIHRTGFVRRFDAGPRWWTKADFPDHDFEYAD